MNFQQRFGYFYAMIASPNFGLVGVLQLLRLVDFCHGLQQEMAAGHNSKQLQCYL